MSVAAAEATGTPPVIATEGPVRAPPADGVVRGRLDAQRTVVYLMAFRAGLATLLLASVIGAALSQGDAADKLSGPFARFALGVLVTTYVATIGYALALRRVRNTVRFAYLQTAVDLALTTAIVHATGGGQSAFSFLYLVDVVAVALLARRRGAAAIAAASGVLLVLTSLGGYLRLIPVVPGQPLMPWDMSQGDLTFRLAINLAALVGVGVLASSLATQTRVAGERMTAHARYAEDIASLHENTIRCLSSGLVTVDMAGRLTSINDAASDILGVSRDACVGQPIEARLPGLGAILAEAGPGASLRREELSVHRPDGSLRHLGISAAPLSDHTGRVSGRVIHFQDLTELRHMQQQVARSERLATVGRLAAGIAHEIRNPLAGISGSIEMLRTLPGADDDNRALMDIAIREVDRLNRLLTDLLEYARPPSEERRAINLREEAQEIVRAFEPEQRGKGIHVELESAVDTGVEAAPGQIRQIAWNLLRNAAEALPASGGVIRIRVRRESSPRGPESILQIADSGMGIAPADRARIFEPFFSTKSGGTGLGLATVARIVEDHRGTVEFESEAGVGTTFTIRFPAADLPPRTLETTSPPS